jgi:hypothetical protein
MRAATAFRSGRTAVPTSTRDVYSGRTLTAIIDGKRYLGDPARIELTAHREIALVFGTAGQQQNAPRSYAFPSGE